MKIIFILSICCFLYCFFNKQIKVSVNDKETDSILARTIMSAIAAILFFVLLSIILSPIYLLLSFLH